MHHRRIIGQVFRTLKAKGTGIEGSLLADGKALEDLAAALAQMST